jgi:hypothetical protein
MPKQLRDYPIYIAPQIRGYRDKNTRRPMVYDERTKTNLDPTIIEDKIIIYERQVKDWFLNIAKELVNDENGGFVSLMISIAYIEGVEQYMEGRTSINRESKQFFIKGIRRIFEIDLLNITDDKLEDFYEQVRCGLFHNGMTMNKVIINNTYKLAIDFSEFDTIKINPKKFLKKVIEDFETYLEILRDANETLKRNNFYNMFSNL